MTCARPSHRGRRDAEGLGAGEPGAASGQRGSCARHPRILPRRNSTAGSIHNRVHRRSPRGAWVEPICKALPIAPSIYHDHVAKRRVPSRLSTRAKCDEKRKVEVQRVFEENFRIYGVRKVWRQFRREGLDVARWVLS